MVCKSVQNLEDTLRRLDKEPTYATYTAVSNAIDSVSLKESGLIPLRLAVLRNFTIDPIIPVIKGEMALSGFYTVVYLGGYDAISQDVFNDKSSLYEFKPDIIILAQWLETLSPLLTRKFGPSVSDQVNNEIERVLNGIDEFNGALRRNVNAPILINNFNIPSYPALGILDAQSENHQTQAILNLNKSLYVTLFS